MASTLSTDDEDMSDEPIRTEHVDGHDIDVEVEDRNAPEGIESRYDPNLIRVDPKTFSLGQILDMLKKGELDLSPDFQRKKVWKPWQKSRLIESVFLRIPLPAFYFAADSDGLMHVVDGLQRLSTIQDFAQGAPEFNTLTGLQYLREEQLGGLTFKTIQGNLRRRLEQAQIFVHVIDPQTPIVVKYQIFQRLNQGGEPLTAQEIRNSISRKRSRDFLRHCVESEAFQRATHGLLKDHPRMADLEAMLRCAAFRLEGQLGAYDQHGSLDDFLTAATRLLDSPKLVPDERLSALFLDLTRGLGNAHKLFGDYTFRRWPEGTRRRYPLNKPLLESWTCALADYQPEQVMPHKREIISRLRAECAYGTEYWAAIATATGNAKHVRKRFQVAREILTNLIK